MFETLEIILPTLVAILALVLYSPKTRWLCFTAVALSVVCELLTPTMNVTAAFACIVCLLGLFLSEAVDRRESWGM